MVIQIKLITAARSNINIVHPHSQFHQVQSQLQKACIKMSATLQNDKTQTGQTAEVDYIQQQYVLK